jgi:hypothetical protein
MFGVRFSAMHNGHIFMRMITVIFVPPLPCPGLDSGASLAWTEQRKTLGFA